MNTQKRRAVFILCSICAAATIAVVIEVVTFCVAPSCAPLWTGMTVFEVENALVWRTTPNYDLYDNSTWFLRWNPHFNKLFVHEEWIGYTLDERSHLISAYGYHSVSINIPIVGSLDYSFPTRQIKLRDGGVARDQE